MWRRQFVFVRLTVRRFLVRPEIELPDLTRQPFELLQTPQLASTEPILELLPPVDRLLGTPHSPEHLPHRRPGLRLLQREANLLLGKLALLHGSTPPLKGLTKRKNLHSCRTKNRQDVKTNRAGHWLRSVVPPRSNPSIRCAQGKESRERLVDDAQLSKIKSVVLEGSKGNAQGMRRWDH